MKSDMLGNLVFRRSFFGSYFRIMSNPSQKAICSTRNKSQMAPNEKMCFHEKLGLRSNTPGKRLCFGRESPVFEESMKEEDQCTSIFHFADRPELPYEVDFEEIVFPKQIGLRKT